jgi:PleD family two-component response regulator
VQIHSERRLRVRTEADCPQQAAEARLTVADVLVLVVADYKTNSRRARSEVERHEARLSAHFGPKRAAAELKVGDVDV